MNRTIATIALSSTAVLLLGACGDSGASTSAASCSDPIAIENADFAATASSVPLPDDAILVGGRYTAISGEPGMFGAAIDICDPAVTTADDLRPIATAYAKALKASPLSGQISKVWVESYQVDGDEVINDVKVKDSDFQMHLWNGKPSEEFELTRWEVISG
ncbi:hypothetical protein [Rhodococcus marinonascens]|uniref:hypothetical protein n=1 Tax=Rhodococcus marinonascens TaxID=38311 RepID=UPI000932A1B2|nr:hypothetical protein [Rhodococcus marinonascens]